MSKIVWDQLGEHFYETGVKNGVLYPAVGAAYPKGVAWNGLSAVNESPSGAEETAIYADDQKYLSLLSAEDYGITIEAYTFPDEFGECDGSAELMPGVTIGQQDRKSFGFCYTTTIGNDTDGNAHGKKINIVYGCKATPSEKSHSTINDSPEAVSMSWEVKTTPVPVTGKKSTACLSIDSTKLAPEKLAAIEAVLFGTDEAEPRLPLPDEIASILAAG